MAGRILKKLILIAVIIAVLALGGVSLSCDNSSGPSEAPDFTLPTITGANITLSELEGTPVVLNFWATWCPHCITELHYFEAVAQEGEGEIRVIAIDVGESASTVQGFLQNLFGYEPTMTVALDRNGEVFVSYCQNYNNPKMYIPFTLFVDTAGLVQYVRFGPFTSEAELWDKLNDVLGIAIP